MAAFISFVVFCQALGAVIGVIGAVWGEIAYLRAVRDGKIDHAEKAHMKNLSRGLTFGMTLLLISSLVLVVTAYISRAALQPALTANYWTLVLFAFLVIYVSWALSRKKIAFALGSAIAFSAWWLLAYLTLGLMPPLSFMATIAFFIVATAIFHAILEYARFLARPRV